MSEEELKQIIKDLLVLLNEDAMYQEGMYIPDAIIKARKIVED
jgi:hypothetical protein